MPTVLRVEKYRFFFFADEGSEPPHVHVEAAEKRAKFWLEPLQLNWNDGFRTGELKSVEGIILAHLDWFLEAWHAFFAGR